MEKTSSEDHIKLGQLLQKERTPARRREVEIILADGLSTKDKIRLIQKLDQGATNPPLPSPVPSTQAPPEQPILPQDLEKILNDSVEEPAGPSLGVLEKNREFLKKPLIVQGFFSFLFFEKSVIKKFGVDTRTMISKGFFNLQLSSVAVDGLSRGWKLAGKELTELLEKLLDRAWLQISRTQYNALSALWRFAKSLKTFSISEDLEHDQLVPFFKDVERDYLVLTRDSGTMDAIFSALESLGKKDLNLETHSLRVWRIWRKLTGGTSALPGFENLILAVNMLRCRRYLVMGDLLAKGVGPTLSSHFFEGPANLYEKINAWILTSEKRLATLVKHWEETLSLNKYFPANGRDDFHILEIFYNFGEEPARQSFTKDFEYPPVFFTGLINKFLSSFRNLLSEEISILPRRKVRVFQNLLFNHELDKLTLCAGRISKISYVASHFTRKHYFELKSKTKAPTGYDASLMQVLEETMTSLMSVARKLIDILKFCGPLSPGEGSEPIGALALQGRPSAIPYFDEILTELGPINGKSIHHCLESIISLCLQTALAFHETLVMSILHSQDQWEKDIRSILSVIERVGSPAANQYFRQKYHL